MNKAFLRSLLSISGGLFVGACGTLPEVAYPEQAAVISFSNQQTTASISEAVSSLLNKDSITISEDAFAKSDLLVIHRAQLLGRDYGDSVEHFRLVKQNESCILLHEKSGNREKLEGVTCELRAGIEQR